MPFTNKVREEVLVRSHRRCCVCHEFAGRDVNVHHITQEADGGSNTIDNAICLCLRCHSEAGHFNSRHPMGTMYSPSELKAHRDQWWEYCKNHPIATVQDAQEEIARLRQFLTHYAHFFRYVFNQGSELAFRTDIECIEIMSWIASNWRTDKMRSFDPHIRELQDKIVVHVHAIYEVLFEDENVYVCNDRFITFDGSLVPNKILNKKRGQIGPHVEAIASCHHELSEIATGLSPSAV